MFSKCKLLFAITSNIVLGVTAFAQTQTTSVSYSGNPLYIAPATANVSTVGQIYVAAGLTVTSVTVQLNVQYPTVSDLVVYLFSARGTRTALLQNECGGLANVNTTFDDTAPTKYSSFCPQEAGRGPFRGDEPLSNSKGEFAAGYWQIVVQNTKSNSNTGSLLGFSVNITGTPVTQPSFSVSSVANAASLTADGFVAPGELVTIYGVALGPQTGVEAGSGNAPTSLGGTTVTFDNVPAPILYSSYYQLNVIAPYSLQPGGTTQVKIQTSTGTTSSVGLDVLSSAAGLFTAQSNGAGQALALNQNGSVNSASNPAAAGSYIALYATGLGAVTPAVPVGAQTPTSGALSNVNNMVTAFVGGVSAPVTFAGLAPGYIGLYQVNIQIPSSIPSGRRRVFLVAPNGYSTQTGAYVYVQ
jgi:uncharacterized protein (TIGR03437 family)